MKILGLAAFSLMGVLSGSPKVDASPSIQEQRTSQPIYSDLIPTIALENDHVVVQRFIIQPAQSTGYHTHAAHQLLVFVKGGVLRSKAGRSTLWPDGRVVWFQDSGHDEASTNAGRVPIELLWVTLKPVESASRALTSGKTPKYGYLNYPNIPGEDVLENDRVIVQRFKLNPGEWEGVHAHNSNTFYIFIKGGQWVSKSREHPEGVPGYAEAGAVAWMDAIDIGDEHQSGSVGTNSSEVVWVALKK